MFIEGLMLKLKLQYFGHRIRRADSLEKTLVLERLKVGGEGDERMRWLYGITNSMDMSLGRLWEFCRNKAFADSAVSGFALKIDHAVQRFGKNA